ncbi:phage head-tail connector protein [Amycolatopsis sp. NPDC006131]|uniref:phage head-tail connector protein n=1 Tax=Amycolatopsis sp. NPDC006131 TaxID=3156731 RepID=UPI00339F7D94
MSWPPTLDDLKLDLKITEPDDVRDDAVLEVQLDAAVAFVERVRSDIDYTEDEVNPQPKPDPDLVLGTIRLAGRWFTRRRSPDALVAMGELGSARIPSFDPDIERLLGIGRYRGPVFA